MSNWNEESIRAKRAEKAIVIYENADRDALIKRILDLEVGLYPFAYCLGSLDMASWRGTYASSKLFPMLDEKDDSFMFYKDGNSQHVKSIPETDMHAVDYYTVDSIIISDGRDLDDSFSILAVHQEAPGAYVGCGDIAMGDVRRARRLLWPDEKEKQD